MFKILVATDGSRHAAAARQLLCVRALPEDTEVYLLVVDGPLDASYYRERPVLQEVWHDRQRRAEQALLEAVEELRKAGIKAITLHRTGEIAHEIAAAAHGLKADLVVVGSHGHSGLKEFLLGSVARNVIHHAAMSVLLGREVRDQARNTVLAVDGSAHSDAAVELMARWPMLPGTAITVVHVQRPYQPAPLETVGAPSLPLEGEQHEQERAAEIVEAAASRLTSAGRDAAGVVLVGDPAREILRLVEQKQADLVVMGTRGVSLLERIMLGSVADRVLHHAGCSVLLVR